MPSYLHQSAILCKFSSFIQHCSMSSHRTDRNQKISWLRVQIGYHYGWWSLFIWVLEKQKWFTNEFHASRSHFYAINFFIYFVNTSHTKTSLSYYWSTLNSCFNENNFGRLRLLHEYFSVNPHLRYSYIGATSFKVTLHLILEFASL